MSHEQAPDGAAGEPAIDEAALRTKYRQERDKRLRADGLGQYVYLDEDSGHLSDPFAGPPEPREPRVIDTDVAILGGGMSCIMSAARLLRAGVEDFVIVEKAADFGGTWYWNRYPGVRCDVEAYIYLPFLEELGYMPSERYTRGHEIWQYQKAAAAHFDLYRRALLQTRVVDAQWHEQDKRWIVRTDRGDLLRARFVLAGLGQSLHRPKLPGVPGIDSFRGKTFHTSRWDYAYTGGGPDGGLAGLRDKRVALIGTGATGVQVMPMLAQDAGHLYVVQRTPTIVDERNNASTDAAWYASLGRDWQASRVRNFDAILSGLIPDDHVVGDQWSQLWGHPAWAPGETPSPEQRAARARDYDLRQVERIRRRIDATVADPATAAALKPWYGARCKRPTFNDYYYPSFNRPNVSLLDTDGRGPDRITEDAIVVQGRSYAIDCIVYATGFDAYVSPSRAAGFDFVGRLHASLAAKWEHGAVTVHGMYSHGFPNLFIVGGGRQGVTTVNAPLTIGTQATHASEIIARLMREGRSAFEVTEAAEHRWADTLAAHSKADMAAIRECTPSVWNSEGDASAAKPLLAAGYGGGILRFIDLLQAWREQGMAGDVVYD